MLWVRAFEMYGFMGFDSLVSESLFLTVCDIIFFNDTATTEIYTLSSHLGISYAVFCLKKKNNEIMPIGDREWCTGIKTVRGGAVKWGARGGMERRELTIVCDNMPVRQVSRTT